MRKQLVRNSLVAFFNGLTTLVILLIAPLGLAAVLVCTLAVTLSSLVIGLTADRIVRFLQGTRPSELVEVERD
ncbi:CRISPR-associated protein Csx18 [Candidatus Cyanaurora vandensis]|uniref:CRISPR-associated protein Csx18 n=1 Tax=Candidatus Cyanaurora vandensis TaxID=2714958 RepID=UPI00257F3658|nr:CRISPR-associated protein Csx18 [Candidatus Cyanaurora vandensis]